MGLSISYDRIRQIEDWIATSAYEQFEDDGFVVPSCGLSVPMDDCNHEEADTRIMVHIRHALEQGAETVLVRTVDTDVVVILVGLFFDLVTIQPSSSGSHAVWGKTTGCITTVFVRVWGNPDHEPYRYSMLFLAVIRHLHSMKREDISVASLAGL